MNNINNLKLRSIAIDALQDQAGVRTNSSSSGSGFDPNGSNWLPAVEVVGSGKPKGSGSGSGKETDPSLPNDPGPGGSGPSNPGGTGGGIGIPPGIIGGDFGGDVGGDGGGGNGNTKPVGIKVPNGDCVPGAIAEALRRRKVDFSLDSIRTKLKEKWGYTPGKGVEREKVEYAIEEYFDLYLLA